MEGITVMEGEILAEVSAEEKTHTHTNTHAQYGMLPESNDRKH